MTVNEYLRIIMKKKNISMNKLAKIMSEQTDLGGKVFRNNIYDILVGKKQLSETMARRIEIALELPEKTLIRFATIKDLKSNKK